MDDDNERNCGTILDGLSPKCGAILATTIAAILSEGLDSNQVTALGGFLVIVGDSMGYIAAQMELNDQVAERCRRLTDQTKDQNAIHTK